MTDTTHRTGSAGLPPSNLLAGNTYNPTIGGTTHHPTAFPPGTPVVQSLVVDRTVIPGKADDSATTSVVGLAAITGVVGSQGLVQFEGVLTLTTAQWDVITSGSGGLTRGVPYYLSSGFREGQLTTTPPSAGGTFVVQVGVALSPTDMLIQICAPEAN